MRIAIIGAGFTGLSAAYTLLKKGHTVTVFEKDEQPGGLAIGYKEPNWDWTLEKHYHHWFTNDRSVLRLAEETNYHVLIKRPKTSAFVQNVISQLDSAASILQFPGLSPLEKIRMSAVLAFLKFDPYWKPLERFNASHMLPKLMGEKPYELLWKPLFVNKFGSYANDVSLAWFWARIYKRTPSLAYPEQGFLAFADHLVATIREQGGKVLFGEEIVSLGSRDKRVAVTRKEKSETKTDTFDAAIVTLPSSFFVRIARDLPESYTMKLNKLKSLGAINLVLRLKQPFFSDNTYWLSICDMRSPIMAVVEHTNFMDKKHYDNEHIVYLGNYLPREHKYFGFDEKQLLKEYDPFLRKINPAYRQSLIGMKAFKAPFAQPIVPVNYSSMIPPHTTPLQNVFLANIDQVYPWDRGTNYAVEMGENVASLVGNQ